jgi:phosphatidylethanolamine/phosphatidyl-N-methylethanolamine N-methyltransferase
VSWAQATPQIRLIERRAMPPLGHFSLIRFGKDAVAEAAAPSRVTASRA